MSFGGLVAYGDSDDSDVNEQESDTEDKPVETPSQTNPTTTSTGPIDNTVSTPEKGSQDKKVFSNIGSVDDIEDDEFEPVLPPNSQQVSWPASGLGLNLPPPKREAGGSQIIEEVLGPLSQKKTDQSKNTPISEKSILDETLTDSSSKILPLAGLPAPKANKPTSNELNIEEDEIEEEIREKSSRLAELAKPPTKPAKRQPVKISVPSLDDYESDEEDKPKTKKQKKSSTKSGLFALLPEPKNISVKKTNRPLIPYTLTKKAPETSKPSKKIPAKGKRKEPVASVLPGIPTVTSDDEDDGDGPVSFFSFGESARSRINTAPVVTPPVEESEKVEPILLGPWQQKSGTVSDDSLNPVFSNGPKRISAPDDSSSAGGQIISPNTGDMPLEFTGPTQGPSYPSHLAQNVAPVTYDSPTDYQHVEQSSGVEQYLQDEEFLKLAGKRQRGKEKIDIIDVHAHEQTSVEQLTKNLTEEVSGFSHSRKKDDLPSSQSRRKHQITYLAYQAKERELELKNQWSQNKLTKRQTQSKYGF